MENGWVKIHRKLLENPFMRKPAYVSLWVTLLLKANHKENKFMWNHDIIVIKEGQFITSRDELSRVTGINRSSIERILKTLEIEHQIEQQKTTKYRLITIVNWKEYQEKNSKVSNKRATDEQQMSTNKNDKNVNNERIAETSSADVSLLIKSFESINPACKRMYGNITQRKACQFLVDNYSMERVLNVIEKTLPRTNELQFFPTITTPVQLQDKWSTLESAIKKYQAEKQNTISKNKVAF